MRPRGPGALFLLLPLLVASPAQLGAQVSAQLSVPASRPVPSTWTTLHWSDVGLGSVFRERSGTCVLWTHRGQFRTSAHRAPGSAGNSTGVRVAGRSPRDLARTVVSSGYP